MEDESTAGSGIIKWLAKLTRKVTSGKIVPIYYGENLPSQVADSVRAARALRALAQDQGLLRLLPALSARHFQAPAVLPQDGARAVSSSRNSAEVTPERAAPIPAPPSSPTVSALHATSPSPSVAFAPSME